MNVRKFSPKRADHPSIGQPCYFCDEPFKEGDETSLVALGPVDADEATKKAEGRPYTAVGKEVHWTCYRLVERTLTGEFPPSELAENLGITVGRPEEPTTKTA